MNSTESILILDRSAQAAADLASILELEDFEVEEAYSAQDGLQLADRIHPALILLDVGLPGTDVAQLCRELKAHPDHAGILVVFLCESFITPEERFAALDAGADDFLSRHLSSWEWVARIQGLLRLKRTETALRESNQKLESALHSLQQANLHLTATLDALPDLLFEVDREGAILDFRAPKPDMLYAHPESFIGKPIRQVLPAPAAQVIESALAEAMEKGRHFGSVYSLDMAGGRRWFELSLAAKGEDRDERARFIALVRDITERIQNEYQRKKIEERFQRVVVQAGDGISFMDLEENFLIANPAADHIFGLPPGGLTGRNLLDFLPEEALEEVKRQTALRLEGRQSSYVLDILRFDGQRRHLSITAFPERDAEGRIHQIVGIFRDITR